MTNYEETSKYYLEILENGEEEKKEERKGERIIPVEEQVITNLVCSYIQSCQYSKVDTNQSNIQVHISCECLRFD